MSFQEISGQQLAKQMMQQALRSGKLSHAYLFHGPKGTGKFKMAFNFAKALFCEQQSDDACGTCIECRKYDHGNHPGLQLLEPEGQTIKLEQIKHLQHELSFRATTEQARVYIVQQAERMTTEAANRMLKFLEEPHAGIIAILLTDNGQAVLPTIQSRTQWIPFFPMAPSAMLDTLIAEGEAESLARPAVHLATGIERARELIQLNWFAEMRKVMIQCAKANETSLATASMVVMDRILKTDLAPHIETLLDLFVLWYKDKIHICSGHTDKIVFIDEREWLVRQAYSRRLSHWVYCMEQALETQKRLRANANAQLSLEYFFSKIKGG